MNTSSTRLRAGLISTALVLGTSGVLVAPAPPASAAVPGLTQVTATSPSNNADKSVTVNCPPGKAVVNAAGMTSGAAGYVTMTAIKPNATLTSVTVTANKTDAFAGNWFVRAYAKCADPLPGLVRVATTSALSAANKSITATCPAGRRVIGTGAAVGGAGNVIIDDLRPEPGLTQVTVTGDEDVAAFATPWSVTAFAICANPLPGLVRVRSTSAPSAVNKTRVASCPAGTVLLGTGAETTGAGGDVLFERILPNNTSVSVVADEEDPLNINWTETAYAICATP